MHIGHVIPRDPQFTDFGDACLTAGGAFCDTLESWFKIHWSAKKTKKAIADNTIHINLLEFAVVIFHLAAVFTITEEPKLLPSVAAKFPNGIPKLLSKLLIRTDNIPSQNWAHKVSSRSGQGQQMEHIFAALLERTSLVISCTHIAGKDNSLTDFISRPPTHMLSPAWRHHQQILKKEPKLTYRLFQSTAEFISNLESKLFSKQWTARTILPKQLGQFEVAGYITSSFVSL